MDVIMWLLPVCITLFVMIRGAIRTWKNGLFMALMDLCASIASAYLAFLLTRLLINPARVDLFGLGALLLRHIPAGFLAASPRLEAFFSALPTAILALLFFTIAFEVLRLNSYKLLEKGNKKFGWSEKLLQFKAAKPLSMGVGALTAMVCILADLVVLSGVVTFSGNMLYCAEVATGDQIFSVFGGSVHTLHNNPVFRIANTLGCYEAFCDLTTAQRDGEEFSVGQELNDISETFVKLLPIFDALSKDGAVPTAEELRALPDALGDSTEVMELLTGLVRSNTEALGSSDAVMIVSRLIGTTPEVFEAYLEQLAVENAHDDLTTFCNIAALLADRGLLPEEGENFRLDALEEEALLAEVRQELEQNPELMAALSIS